MFASQKGLFDKPVGQLGGGIGGEGEERKPHQQAGVEAGAGPVVQREHQR